MNGWFGGTPLFLGYLHTCIFSCLIQFDWGQSFWATRNPVSSPDLVHDFGTWRRLSRAFGKWIWDESSCETALRTCNMESGYIWMSLAFSSLKM
jgi:hypothetical protein